MSIFSSLKNHAIQSLANKFLKPYGGEIIDLFIDKQSKVVTATIALEGEIRPARITMSEVRIIFRNDSDYLSFDKIVVDREWIGKAIEMALKRFLPEKAIVISSKMSAMLKMII